MSTGYHPLVIPAPQRLIQSDGQPIFGLFSDSVPDLAWADFDYRSIMDQPVTGLRRYFAQKQFQFATVAGQQQDQNGHTKEWLLAVAIAHIGYVSSGFVYLYRQDQPVFAKSILQPLRRGCQMSASPQQGLAKLQAGALCWQFALTSDSWHVQIAADTLQADLVLKRQPTQRPLALCAPTGYQGTTYTEKNNALSISGHLQLAADTFSLQNARGGYDYSAGFMRRTTNWRWASIHTTLAAGNFGLNLANGVNETGLTENALWWQGQIQYLSPAQFEFSRYQPNSPWQIRTLCGELALTFEPLYCRQERLNTLFLQNNFRQYVGLYSGRITLADGQELQLERCLGLAEDHYAKW